MVKNGVFWNNSKNIDIWILCKEQKNLIECSEPVEKKSGHSNNFWVSYGPLKYVYKWSKMSFSWITPKILTFEYYAKNKTYSEVNFICVYRIWSKLIEKWPPKIQDGCHEIQFFYIYASWFLESDKTQRTKKLNWNVLNL